MSGRQRVPDMFDAGIDPEAQENLDRVVEHRGEEVRVRRRPLEVTLTGNVQHIIEMATPLEEEANKLGIYNVFDDGGYRTLLMLTMFGLKKAAEGRLGDDAVDRDGHSFELKTINLISTKGELKKNYPGVTTEHTLRQENVERYRACRAWLIGVFQGNVPLDVYVIESEKLEPYYRVWEQGIAAAPNHELNNPKISLAFIARFGTHHPVPGTSHIPRPKMGAVNMPEYRPSKRRK